MAEYNNYQQFPRWFNPSFNWQRNGEGVDHAFEPSFGLFGPPPHHDHPHPFGWQGPHADGPWGRRGRGGPGGMGGRGGHCRRGRERGPPGEEQERNRSRTASPSGEHTEGEGATSGNEGQERRAPFGRRGGGHHGRGRHAHGRHGGRGSWDRRGPPPFGGPGAFDLSGLLASINAHPAVAGHPLAQMFRQFAEQAGVANRDAQESGEIAVNNEEENSFIPPIDVFSTETAYILHIALPGAKKEDVGVNWDSDKGELNIAGVVYRKGDEEFLKTLTQSERKVGVFERSVKLPPGSDEKEEIDGDNINAKLEDGVLTVTVPKVEKDWTEVKRVDIQ